MPRYNRNQFIRSGKVLVLDENGENLGVMDAEEAVRLAQERELDLVEINPKVDPPVCKIVDFSEFKYQKEKQARKQKAHSRASEVKGIRLSMRISDHDLEIKEAQAEKFLDRGDKVKLELMMRGRENAKQDIGQDILERFMKAIEQKFPIRIEQEITKQGHKITSIIAKK